MPTQWRTLPTPDVHMNDVAVVAQCPRRAEQQGGGDRDSEPCDRDPVATGGSPDASGDDERADEEGDWENHVLHAIERREPRENEERELRAGRLSLERHHACVHRGQRECVADRVGREVRRVDKCREGERERRAEEGAASPASRAGARVDTPARRRVTSRARASPASTDRRCRLLPRARMERREAARAGAGSEPARRGSSGGRARPSGRARRRCTRQGSSEAPRGGAPPRCAARARGHHPREDEPRGNRRESREQAGRRPCGAECRDVDGHADRVGSGRLIP